MRTAAIHHCTSVPWRFFGRRAELLWLDDALRDGSDSVLAMVGPGGQGKTAIVQHWLEQVAPRGDRPDGIFLWSFYRGKDSDLCLRELFAYAEGLTEAPEVSASFCVDQLVPRLRRERWALVLDGTEVVQHEHGAWQGRFLHPELGRLLEELAGDRMPGVAVLTTRFPLPTLETRRHARLISLSTLDSASACGLLATLGVRGSEQELQQAAQAAGLHAKAVELLGTFLVRFRGGDCLQHVQLPPLILEGGSAEEIHVARILDALAEALPQETKDILALATAFRQPPTEARLLEYLVSEPLTQLLHATWGRSYVPFLKRPVGWLQTQVQELVDLRLLERVGQVGRVSNPSTPVEGPIPPSSKEVLDAHPLVRRGFENSLGSESTTHGVPARAGFLRGRPDRRPPQNLEEAREEVELFHAYADGGLWNEADGTLVALDNPKHRFLAPAFERDLLLRFFPENDWRRPPLWLGFGRQRSLAICFELLGQFEEALSAYKASDAPLRGDALIALGRLQPFLDQPQVPEPWQTLWQAYRAHALCLLGQTEEALRLARSLVPIDVYEWVHVFECLLRLGQLGVLDLGSLLYRPPLTGEHRWSTLARERMRLDYLRLAEPNAAGNLGPHFLELMDAYDRGGLPFERALTRLSYARWLISQGRFAEALASSRGSLELAARFGMRAVAADALEMQALLEPAMAKGLLSRADVLRGQTSYRGPGRP